MLGMQTRARNPGLDLLRSAAILLVMLWHVPGVAVPEFALRLRRVGWTGVDLFFVLSGYLIGRQLMRAYARGVRPSFGDFICGGRCGSCRRIWWCWRFIFWFRAGGSSRRLRRCGDF